MFMKTSFFQIFHLKELENEIVREVIMQTGQFFMIFRSIHCGN